MKSLKLRHIVFYRRFWNQMWAQVSLFQSHCPLPSASECCVLCVCTRVHAHEHRGQREPRASFIRHHLPLFFSERQGLSLDWNSPSQGAVKPDFKYVYVWMCTCVCVRYMCICTYQCTSSCARMWKPEYFRCPTLAFIPLRQASLNETNWG